ncbi:toll/interleukin-1 receptor domain-containing protein [Stigmatella aurantiaca]|uniref:TIR domain-containing protein n=1 Tax=Stigmatella aurantiaca (strain DW4/3-1) TaxID=378806 RepID=E3FEF1_STIAD|nr:toll/interleukin-1 receptor domain-containing protein [Stigmatella aurantiaca]ADO73921.1 uncharacterized protein STAUR_6164 [Stigmatella aurantiaca DW4/3-1]
MPRDSRTRQSGRLVFISHAAADKELVNFFVDTVLITGIGINHASIFNTSSTSSPIPPGSNFTEDIRKAMQDAECVIALVTTTYRERAFAMAELGAAWALDRLVPILVPPLDFKDTEGVLKGTQCFKINNKEDLSHLYDYFADLAKGKRSWLNPTGSATFERHRDKFLRELAQMLKENSSPEKSIASESSGEAQVAQSAAQPPLRSSEDVEKDFERLVSELREALAKLPVIVRVAFMFSANGSWVIEKPVHTQEIDETEHLGLIKAKLRWDRPGASKERIYSPTRTGQLNRDVFRVIKELSRLLVNAPPDFHREYEAKNGHPASLKASQFWDTHDLYSEGEPGKETASFRNS